MGKSGLDIGASFDTVYKALPVKFGFDLGSSKENLNKTCEAIFSDMRDNQSSYQYASTVVASSTDAWLACKQLAREGIVFSPSISKTQVVIDVRRVGPQEVEIQGITATPKDSMVCTVPNDNNNQGTTQANDDTRKTLSELNWAIKCERSPVKDDLGWKFGSADITVRTSASRSFSLPVASEEKPNFDWASMIQSKTEELITVQNQLREQNAALATKVGALENALSSAKTNFKMEQYKFYSGEYDRQGDHGKRYDPRDGDPVPRAVADMCKPGWKPNVTLINVHSGNCCGYHYWHLTCSTFE